MSAMAPIVRRGHRGVGRSAAREPLRGAAREVLCGAAREPPRRAVRTAFSSVAGAVHGRAARVPCRAAVGVARGRLSGAAGPAVFARGRVRSEVSMSGAAEVSMNGAAVAGARPLSAYPELAINVVIAHME